MVSDLTKTLNTITGEYFEPLNIESVKSWRDANAHIEKFRSPFYEVLPYRDAIVISGAEAKKLLPILDRVIEAEPSAWLARCLRANCYAAEGHWDMAEQELKRIEEAAPDYATPHYIRACLLATRGDRDKAVESLNKALERWPIFFMTTKTNWERDFFKDARVLWPNIADSPKITAEPSK